MLLGRDLRAVLATVRLRVWELARRNRQGDLAVPGFWPRELSPWFWPLALGLALAALVALLVVVAPLLPGRSPQTAQPPESPRQDQPVLEARPAADPAPAARDIPAAELPVPEPLPEAPPIDPLLVLLQPADPRQLIRAVREQPARSCLELQLSERFAALAPELQLQQAEALRGRALELGYERLELVDGAGGLLGRTARVGSGMILLTSVAAAPDAP